MFSAADYFGISGLKDVANEKMEEELITEWRCPTLLDAIKEIYSMPRAQSQPIRRVLAKCIHRHYRKWKKNERFVQVSEATGLYKDLYDLATDNEWLND